MQQIINLWYKYTIVRGTYPRVEEKEAPEAIYDTQRILLLLLQKGALIIQGSNQYIGAIQYSLTRILCSPDSKPVGPAQLQDTANIRGYGKHKRLGK